MTTNGSWGVRLERVGEAIVIAPSGVLDEQGAGRLRQVLRSREAAYADLLLDLRDLVTLDTAGLELVGEELERSEREAFRLAVVANPAIKTQLRDSALGERLRIVDDVEDVVGPHRVD